MSDPKARRSNGPSLLAQIRDRCAILEDYVRARKLATEVELTEFTPGGDENPIGKAREKPWAWVRWIMALSRFMEREESRDASDGLNEVDILAALNSEPVTVILSATDGVPLRVQVYPKSMEALMFCHARDYALGWLAQKLKDVKLRAGAEDAELLEQIMEEMAFQYHLLAWAVTTEGPGLPFNPRQLRVSGDALEIPAYIEAIQPWDVQRIAIAFAKVNVIRLSALDSLLSDKKRGQEEGKRPSWSIFLGTLAMEKGTDMRDLIRDTDLPRLIAEVRTANEGRTPPKKAPKAEPEPAGAE